MAYKGLMDSSLRLAFNQMKDLAELATFNKVSAKSFDFTSGDASVVTAAAVATKVVVIEASNPSQKSKTTTLTVMVKSKEIGEVKSLEKVSLRGAIWSVVKEIKTDGFIYVLELAREA